MMDELYSASRRANDGTPGKSEPVAVFVPGFGSRSLELARGLQAMGASIISTSPDTGASPEYLAGIRRASMILVGDEVLSNPETIEFTAKLAAGSEVEALIVLVVEKTPLTFEQRRAATELGQVRLMGLEDDLRQLRNLLRSRSRNVEIEGYRVLLLDDSRTDAYRARSFMTEEGLVVEHIQHPSEVLDAITRFKPDVLVTDFHMPEANGDVVASIIRQDRDVTIPIIFLSSESNAERQLLALSSGADGFVQKPLKRGAFINALKSIISRSKAMESRMRRDPLTNLLNHGQLIYSAGALMSEEATNSLVMLDIDHFKRVNDTYGHPVGDRVLVGLADVLANSLRSDDQIGRMGGEEFGIVMVGSNSEQTRHVVERLLGIFTAIEFQADDGVSFSCSFSAGVSEMRGSVKEAIRRADEALYAAKRNGRSRVEVSPGN